MMREQMDHFPFPTKAQGDATQVENLIREFHTQIATGAFEAALDLCLMPLMVVTTDTGGRVVEGRLSREQARYIIEGIQAVHPGLTLNVHSLLVSFVATRIASFSGEVDAHDTQGAASTWSFTGAALHDGTEWRLTSLLTPGWGDLMGRARQSVENRPAAGQPLVRDKDLWGRSVIDHSGHVVGTLQHLDLAARRLQVAAIEVKLRREIEERLGVERRLRAAVITVPAEEIQSVADTVVLSADLARLRELARPKE